MSAAPCWGAGQECVQPLPHLLGLLRCVLNLGLTCIDSIDVSGKQGSSGFSGCQLKTLAGKKVGKVRGFSAMSDGQFESSCTGVPSVHLCLASSLPRLLCFPSVCLQTSLPGSSLGSA